MSCLSLTPDLLVWPDWRVTAPRHRTSVPWCRTGKRSLETYRVAQQAVVTILRRRLRRPRDVRLNVYRCPDCRWWHVGNKPVETKAIRKGGMTWVHTKNTSERSKARKSLRG